MALTRAEVLERIRAHLSEELGIDASTIEEPSRFKEDLEADSLDLVELVVELEDRYGIRMAEDQAERIKTVGQAVDFVSRRLPSTRLPRRTRLRLLALFDELPESLAHQAFSHSSWVGDRAQSYERLAFLGDSVLEHRRLARAVPALPRSTAGRLTKIRAQTVSRRSCVEIARADGRARAHARRRAARLRAPGGAADRGRERAGGGGRGRASAHASWSTGSSARPRPLRRRSSRRSSSRSRTCTTSRASCRSASRAAARWSSTGSCPRRGPPHDRLFETVAEVDGRTLGIGRRPLQEGLRAGGRARCAGAARLRRGAPRRRRNSEGVSRASEVADAEGLQVLPGPHAASSSGRASAWSSGPTAAASPTSRTPCCGRSASRARSRSAARRCRT